MYGSQKKTGHSCRKKAILGDRQVPALDQQNLIWVINMQGSTFLPIGPKQTFKGDPQIQQSLFSRIIPSLNKDISKIWIKQQQHTYKSQIFTITHIIMQILLFILIVTLLAILLGTDMSDNGYYTVLLMCLYCIWGCCIMVLVYSFFSAYQPVNFQKLMLREIREILCEENHLFLKPRGYVAKCDQWGTWICVSKVKKFQELSVDFSSISDHHDK